MMNEMTGNGHGAKLLVPRLLSSGWMGSFAGTMTVMALVFSICSYWWEAAGAETKDLMIEPDTSMGGKAPGKAAAVQKPAADITPEALAWEKTLEENLGTFYLPTYKKGKAEGVEQAWDFVKDDPKLPRALLIGDSISRGYTVPARHALAGKVNLHRAPENCGPTVTGLKKLELWIGSGKWDVIHFNFGIHDAKIFEPADYENRLTMLVERLEQTGARLVWASSTPLPDKFMDVNDADSRITRLNGIAARIMKDHGIPTDDLYGLVKPRQKELQNPDDCHFPEEKYSILGEQVAKSILEALKAPPPARGTERSVDKDTLIWEENFNRAELGPGWRVLRGKAGILDGCLSIEGPAEISFDPNSCQRSFGRDLRVEYDACSDLPGDLSLMLNIASSGIKERGISILSTGYFFGFASQGNKTCTLMAFETQIASKDAVGLAQPGKWHHVMAEKRGDQLRLLVDGQEVVAAKQPRLWGGGGLGFYIWNSGKIDNVKVYAIPSN